MKLREFTFDALKMDLDYNGEVSLDLIQEFVVEDLEVPDHFIESLQLKDTFVNIKLSQTREYFNDDWYINLQRVS